MKDFASRMPDFGSNYLQPGCSVIHFYYSEDERMRFAPFLAEGLLLRQSAVIAGPQQLISQVLDVARPTDGRRRIGPILEVTLEKNIEVALPALAHAIHEAAANGVVRLLADFSASAASDIFQIEAALSTACAGLRLMKVTQYDGSCVPAPVAVEQFKTHSLTVVGDAFYYENRDYITPESYVLKRAAGAGR